MTGYGILSLVLPFWLAASLPASHEPDFEKWREVEKQFSNAFEFPKVTRLIYVDCAGNPVRVLVLRGANPEPIFAGSLEASDDFLFAIGATVLLDHPVKPKTCIET